MKPSRILIPIDFSPYADFALAYAIELAQPLGAQLLLVHVRDTDQLNPFYHTGPATSEARETLSAYLPQAEARGLEADIVIRHGTPGDEIVELAREENIDLIIIGTRGRTGLSSILLGSVAQRVAQYAPCPVLVARRPDSEA